MRHFQYAVPLLYLLRSEQGPDQEEDQTLPLVPLLVRMAAALLYVANRQCPKQNTRRPRMTFPTARSRRDVAPGLGPQPGEESPAAALVLLHLLAANSIPSAFSKGGSKSSRCCCKSIRSAKGAVNPSLDSLLTLGMAARQVGGGAPARRRRTTLRRTAAILLCFCFS